MKEPIKAIVFDWGGVLIESPCTKMYQYWAEELNIPLEEVKRIYMQHEVAMHKGTMTEEEFWTAVCKGLNILQKNILKNVKNESFYANALRYAYKPFPEMFALVEILRKQNYKLGFLSNAEKPMEEVFQEKGLGKLFDVRVFSFEERTAKPEKRIYEILLQRLQQKAEEVVFIDDKQENVAGAQSVGMKGILFRSPEQVKDELKQMGVKVD